MTIENSCEQSNEFSTRSLLRLGIERMELDWGKIHNFREHSVLFTKGDVKKVPTYCYDCESEKIIEGEYEGFSSRLSTLRKRLDLLGYDLQSIRKKYDDEVHEWQKCGTEIKLSFDTFFKVISTLNIASINTVKQAIKNDEDNCDYGEYVKDFVFYNSTIINKFIGKSSKTDESSLFSFLENLDPYIILRILAENPKNIEKDVFWIPETEFDGYQDCNEVCVGCPAEKKILIVTEGPTDKLVLNKSIKELHPEIYDIFRFIDIENDNLLTLTNNKFPLNGAGGLETFCKALFSINYQNNIIVVFDNDVAGNRAYSKLQNLIKPKNFVITKLPHCNLFSKMKTAKKQEPSKESVEDVNEAAVSIEFFLDFKSIEPFQEPRILWTKDFDNKMNRYQGYIENKNLYTDVFKTCNLTDGSYDTRKLELLIKHIYESWLGRSK